MTAAASPARRLYRDPSQRVVAGVAAGIAEHLEVPRLAVRLAFVLLASFAGLGPLLYAAFWAVLPVTPGVTPARRQWVQLLPLVALGLGVGIIQWRVGRGGWAFVFGWLLALVALGAGIMWHQADPERRRRLHDAFPQVPWIRSMAESGRPGYLLRFIGGGVLVIIGIIGVAVVFGPGASFAVIGSGLLFAVLALLGVGLVFAPVLWRTITQLRDEREARIREQERADVAAMIHDQVLHTLALVQRNAGDVKEVQRLARAQERTLRNWLYKPTASPAERFAAALEEASAEVEDTFGLVVETVVVGDVEVDERVAAVVGAAREALVNAGRHAKVLTVSLYAEVEPDQISVFVRDRGVGFVLGDVDDDRHGVRGSIIGRMARHGGRAELRSAPGDGTEVRLTMPTAAGGRA